MTPHGALQRVRSNPSPKLVMILGRIDMRSLDSQRSRTQPSTTKLSCYAIHHGCILNSTRYIYTSKLECYIPIFCLFLTANLFLRQGIKRNKTNFVSFYFHQQKRKLLCRSDSWNLLNLVWDIAELSYCEACDYVSDTYEKLPTIPKIISQSF